MLKSLLMKKVLNSASQLWTRGLLVGLLVAIALLARPAIAARIDPYVARYLQATQPVTLPLNPEGALQEFTPLQLTQGKQLFEANCKNCHVGGTTLPDPTVPLSLAALKGGTPPRDTIAGLVAFMRRPLVYQGDEETVECRQVTPDWMTDAQIETLAAFILRAAERSPGWGTAEF